MAQNSPEKNDTYYTQAVLYLPHFHHPDRLKTLVSEWWNAAVLDSGATNTVAGESWFNCFMSSLSKSEKQKVQYHPFNSKYRFGDGKLFPALQNIDIPIIFWLQNWQCNDIWRINPTTSCKSGLYGIPISPYNTVLNNVTTGLNKSVTLLPTNKNKSKYDIALKLHRKFAHPSPDKLIKLINSAGEHWERMRNLKKSLKNVSDACKICQI